MKLSVKDFFIFCTVSYALFVTHHLWLTFESNSLWNIFMLAKMSSEAATTAALYKKGVLKTRKHLCQSLFFNKVAGLRPAILLERDSGTGVFRWVLWNLQEQLFYRTSMDDWVICWTRGWFVACVRLYLKTIKSLQPVKLLKSEVIFFSQYSLKMYVLSWFFEYHRNCFNLIQ